MEQLRKVVAVGCLTYFIYGITSAFQLGTFLPPIPLKPFLYLLFVVVGLVYTLRFKTHFISYALLSWLVLYALNSHAFLEISLNTKSMLYYEEYISVFVSLVMMLMYTLHSVFLLFGVVKENKRLAILFLPLIGGIAFHFIDSTLLPFNIIIICWTLFVFILERTFAEKRSNLFKLNSILYGVGVIEAVEMVSFFF